jgi:hypothetical protein
MSLPGQWTDEQETLSPSQNLVQKQQRQFQDPNYADPAVTQFCNEHLKELDDLQNVGDLIASLKEEQSVVAARVDAFLCRFS